MKKVSVICIDCEPGIIDIVLGNQTYSNLEVVEAVTGKGFYQDIVDYCENTDSEFICFLEQEQWLFPDKIKEMADYAEKLKEADVIFCNRSFCEPNGAVISHPDQEYRGVFQDTLFQGSRVLYRCMENGHNLLGNLTTAMFRRGRVELCMDRLEKYDVSGDPAMQKTFLLFEILAGRIMALLEKVLVATFVQEINMEGLRRQEALFESQCRVFSRCHGWEWGTASPSGISRVHKQMLQGASAKDLGLKKEITFFTTDRGEYYNLLPIMEEAKKRGYQVSDTEDLNVKAEIGIYCQHVGKPGNAKFSVVLLHDMAQGHNRWPNIWETEHWCDYDIGIVPGVKWKERWERSACDYYAYPRCGAYMLGYPKSSQVFSAELEDRVQELKSSMNLKYDITVLYAPSWENDGKEDDFVQALSSLPVNLLVKQASWGKEYVEYLVSCGGENIVENINEMRSIHQGKYDNLYYIEPEESILVALKMCDFIVSDESSIMVEGMMFGKPSIAVSDWLIPDTKPKRFSCIPFEGVYKCKKAELRETAEKFLTAGLKNIGVAKDADSFFVNKKNVNRDILDAIEYFTMGKGRAEFMKWKMSSRYMPINMWS